MNKILKYSIYSLAALSLASCGKEAPFPWDGPKDGEGQLSVKNLVVSVDGKENEVRSTRAVDPAGFTVELLKDGDVVESYIYSEMPEIVTLPVGNYTARVRSGEVQTAAFEAPYYEGEQDFEIKNKEVTEVETVVCKFANVRVSVYYTDALKAHMGNDCKVSITAGRDAHLEFSKDETRSGFFAYVDDSQTMVATFSGTIDGNVQEQLKAYTDVKPGNHYKITFSYHQGDLPDNEGSITFNGVTVDATIEEVDMNVNVDDPDDIIDVTDPWGNDNTGSQEPDDPTPPTPGAGPEAKPEEPLVFDTPIDITDNVINAVVNVHSETGITAFKLNIDSDVLPPEELEGIGLVADLDIAETGEYTEALKGLGLPANVKGEKDVTFNITSFLPLLQGLGTGKSNFKMTITDASGTVTHTLMFVVR